VPAPRPSADQVHLAAPDPARVYDCLIGGSNTLDADRAAGVWIKLTAPDLFTTMQASKAFARRAIRFVSSQGIKQFIDIGCGFPNSPNTHEIAQSVNPAAKVLYTDKDLTVARRVEEYLRGEPGTAFLRSNVLNPEAILAEGVATGLIDLGQPVACMLAAVFHFIPEEVHPDGIVSSLRRAMAPGSYLILSHLASDILWDTKNNEETLRRATSDLYPRTKSRVTEFFGDFDLVAPGLVPAAEWRPEQAPDHSTPALAIYGGVAQKN